MHGLYLSLYVLQGVVWRWSEESGWVHGSGACFESDGPGNPYVGSNAAQWCWCWVTEIPTATILSHPTTLIAWPFSIGVHALLLYSGAHRVGTATDSAEYLSTKAILISRNNKVEPFLGLPDREQRDGCLQTALALRLVQLVAYALWQPRHKVKCNWVLNHGRLWYPKSSVNLHVVCCKSSLTSCHRRSSSNPNGHPDQGPSSTSWSQARNQAIQSCAVYSKTVDSPNALLMQWADSTAFSSLLSRSA